MIAFVRRSLRIMDLNSSRLFGLLSSKIELEAAEMVQGIDIEKAGQGGAGRLGPAGLAVGRGQDLEAAAVVGVGVDRALGVIDGQS